MGFTKRNIIKTAAIGSAFIGALAVAAPASANSFGPTDYGTDGSAMVSYNDSSDTFCVKSTDRVTLTFRVTPENSGRGPSHTFTVAQGESKCVSLATAFEDSHYYYQMNWGKVEYSPVSFYS